MSKDSLHCISAGLTAPNESDINCDQVAEVEAVIWEQIDNIVYSGILLKRKDVVKPLANLVDGVKLGKSTVHIDPAALFRRLLVLVEKADDMAPYFQYELTQIPSSLFQDGRMRKAAKASLGTLVIKEVTMETVRPTERYVLDRGALLHRVKWKGKETYKEDAEQYSKYITSNYDKCTVVFNGCSSGPSIKDHKHERRKGKSAADIKLCETVTAHLKQHEFLAKSPTFHACMEWLRYDFRNF